MLEHSHNSLAIFSFLAPFLPFYFLYITYTKHHQFSCKAKYYIVNIHIHLLVCVFVCLFNCGFSFLYAKVSHKNGTIKKWKTQMFTTKSSRHKQDIDLCLCKQCKAKDESEKSQANTLTHWHSHICREKSGEHTYSAYQIACWNRTSIKHTFINRYVYFIFNSVCLQPPVTIIPLLRVQPRAISRHTQKAKRERERDRVRANIISINLFPPHILDHKVNTFDVVIVIVDIMAHVS